MLGVREGAPGEGKKSRMGAYVIQQHPEGGSGEEGRDAGAGHERETQTPASGIQGQVARG